jgi:DNA polymerase-1
MVAVQDCAGRARLGHPMIMQVHDELVLEVPEAEATAVKTGLLQKMANVAALKVLLVAEAGVGLNWEEAH